MSLIGVSLENALAPEEVEKAAVGINKMLVDMGHPEENITGWWQFAKFGRLADRTPIQAWADGDQGAVHDFVAELYRHTSEVQYRSLDNPDFVDAIRRKLDNLGTARPA